MFEFIEHGPVCEIRMAHPPVNAMSPEFIVGLTGALNEKADQYQALVLSGQPGMFSAGLDLIKLSRLDQAEAEVFFEQFFTLLKTIGACPVPTVAAITGHSPAGGAVMAIHCDYRVMSQGKYKIGLNEVQVGLIVPRQIQQVLARLVGKHQAERLLVAGAMLSSEEAKAVGFVDELADSPEETVAAAVKWCAQHVALPRNAMMQTRKIIRADISANYDDLGQADIDAFTRVWFSQETQAVMGQILAALGKKKD